jgi:hypothetical protein
MEVKSSNRRKFFLPTDEESISIFHKNILEEQFVLMYHLNQGYSDISKMNVYERKWIIDRFIKQREQEDEAINNSKRRFN